jgi:hypothetical protein
LLLAHHLEFLFQRSPADLRNGGMFRFSQFPGFGNLLGRETHSNKGLFRIRFFDGSHKTVRSKCTELPFIGNKKKFDERAQDNAKRVKVMPNGLPSIGSSQPSIAYLFTKSEARDGRAQRIV